MVRTPLRSLLLFAAVGFVVFSGWRWWRGPVHQRNTSEEPVVLVVGTNVGYPPFIMRDQNGHVTGFDYDVSVAIAERLGRPLAVKDMSFDALLLSLPQGSVDMIIGGISLTQARKKKGWLLPYYGEKVDRLSMIYRSDRMSEQLTLAEAADRGLTVCTQAGTSLEEVLENYPGLRLKTLPDISDIFLEVEHANSDVGVLDIDTARVLARSRSWLHTHEVVLPPEQQIEGFGIGIAPYNTELREQIGQVVEQLHEDGTIKRLAQKWF